MSVVDLRGWIDYDRDKLPALSPDERIDYFEKRVRLVAINPLRRVLSTEIMPAADSSALLIFGVSLCRAIEATGKFLTGGQGGNGQRFLAFVDRYMAPDFQIVSILGKRNAALVWLTFPQRAGSWICSLSWGLRGTSVGALLKVGDDLQAAVPRAQSNALFR
jgi:hypothetical protein